MRALEIKLENIKHLDILRVFEFYYKYDFAKIILSFIIVTDDSPQLSFKYIDNPDISCYERNHVMLHQSEDEVFRGYRLC